VLADGDDPGQPALRRALECVSDGGEIEIFSVVYEPMLEGYLGNKAIYEPLRKRVIDERRERATALARAVERHGVRGSAKAVWSHPMHVAAQRRSTQPVSTSWSRDRRASIKVTALSATVCRTATGSS